MVKLWNIYYDLGTELNWLSQIFKRLNGGDVIWFWEKVKNKKYNIWFWIFFLKKVWLNLIISINFKN